MGQKEGRGKEEQSKNIEVKLLGSFLEFKREIAGAVAALFLFFPGPGGSSAARKLYDGLKNHPVVVRQQMPPGSINPLKLVLASSLFSNLKEAQLATHDAYELTKSLNDPKAIKEFLKPNSYFSFDSFYGITINVPSRYNFANVVQSETKFLFQEGAKMKFLPMKNLEGLAQKKREESGPGRESKIPNLYKLNVSVSVEKIAEGSIIFDILKRHLEKKGIFNKTLERKIIDKLLENLFLRISVVATVEIEVINTETGEVINLIAIGVPKKKPKETDLTFASTVVIFKEAISNAYDNLLKVLKEALEEGKGKKRTFSNQVVLVARG